MPDFYFFTNLELLDLIGTGNRQTAQEAFGSLSLSSGLEKFQISSNHRSNSAVSPFAYAVTNGRAAVYLSEDPLTTTCSIILKPSTQPSEVSEISLPTIKYFVYQRVLIDSLLNGIDLANSGNAIDWIDYIWETHPDSIDNNIAAPAVSIKALEFEIEPSVSPISFSFVANSTSTYPNVTAGDSIGKFDPQNFNFEIILDDYRYDPTLEKIFNPILQGAIPHSTVIAAPHIPDTGAALKLFFENRHIREEILNYIDPAAFFACFYNAKLNSKNNQGALTQHTGNQIAENLLTTNMPSFFYAPKN
jgi:hypothetical protein